MQWEQFQPGIVRIMLLSAIIKTSTNNDHGSPERLILMQPLMSAEVESKLEI